MFGSNAPGLKGEVPLSGEFDLHCNPGFSQRVLIAGAPLQADVMATWYSQGAEGYVDYPALEAATA